MSNSARESIYEAIASIRLIDPHTHINPHSPASNTLADLLGYHYYTELAHSAGMPKDEIEEDGLPPRELVHRLVSNLSPIENTAQYRWLVEICRMFFGFDGDRIDLSNWEQVYDSAEAQMQLADWPHMVLDQSNVEAVFLTNDFDDELSGFDSDTYIPCLRTDDLVFHLAKPETRQRLAACTGIELDGSLFSLRESLQQRFEHFVANGARACAISLPPTFQPTPVSDGRAATALDEVLRKGPLSDPSHQIALSRRVFWTLAELCDQYGLPFDLMIGVNRGVYENGVFQGQDLYDSRVSLIQYRELFNTFPAVKFPISVLASVTNQELVSYAWIFPNVITNGHWWYSNTPSFIARDAAARLEAVPQTKQIAYYSDAYKLEFVWPKFDMYRRILSGILADHFVDGCGWSEERAVELGRRVLRENVDEIFPRPTQTEHPSASDSVEDIRSEDNPEAIPANTEQDNWVDPAVAGSSAALAAGAIGMVEVSDAVESDAESTMTQSFADDESYSTVIEPDSSATGNISQSAEEQHGYQDDSSDDTGDEPSLDDSIATVLEADGSAETVRMDEFDEAEFDGEIAAELSTELETKNEVPSEESEPVEFTGAIEPHGGENPGDEENENTESLVGSWPSSEAAEAPVDLDPLPTEDEIQAVEVGDVELREIDTVNSAPDADAIEAEADGESINVGDLLGEEEPGETPAPNIRMLRGEESFQPDSDSLQLQADPATGELTFPVSSSDDNDADVVYEPTDDADVLANPSDDADLLSAANDDWVSEELTLDEGGTDRQDEPLILNVDDDDDGDGEVETINPGNELNPLDSDPFDDADADEALDLDEAPDFGAINDTESPEDPDESGELYL